MYIAIYEDWQTGVRYGHVDSLHYEEFTVESTARNAKNFGDKFIGVVPVYMAIEPLIEPLGAVELRTMEFMEDCVACGLLAQSRMDLIDSLKPL